MVTDVKLVELLRTCLADPRQSESLAQEIVSLLDETTKAKLYEFLSVKVIASLKTQVSKINEAISRYSGSN